MWVSMVTIGAIRPAHPGLQTANVYSAGSVLVAPCFFGLTGFMLNDSDRMQSILRFYPQGARNKKQKIYRNISS